MKGLALAAAIGSVRQLLAIVIAVVAIAGAAYLGTHKLSNADPYAYGSCNYPPRVFLGLLPTCRPPTRFAWQIPLAVVIAIGGLGAAVALGGSADRRALHA